MGRLAQTLGNDACIPFAFGSNRSIRFPLSRIQESMTVPIHVGPCPNTLMALRAVALRRAISFQTWCPTPSRLTGLPSNACEVDSQRLCQRTAVGWRFAPACCAAQSVGQLHLSSTSGASACSAALAKSFSDTYASVHRRYFCSNCT